MALPTQLLTQECATPDFLGLSGDTVVNIVHLSDRCLTSIRTCLAHFHLGACVRLLGPARTALHEAIPVMVPESLHPPQEGQTQRTHCLTQRRTSFSLVGRRRHGFGPEESCGGDGFTKLDYLEQVRDGAGGPFCI